MTDPLSTCINTVAAHLGISVYVSDDSCCPGAEVDKYIGFRDAHGNAISIGIGYDKEIFLVDKHGRSAK